jgi:hypothetical protein
LAWNREADGRESEADFRHRKLTAGTPTSGTARQTTSMARLTSWMVSRIAGKARLTIRVAKQTVKQ